MKKLILLAACAALQLHLTAASLPWPQFRGPDGQGHSSAKNIPVEWSESKNVTWKMPVPGEGWSSPVIGAGQIWMTSSQEGGKSLYAVCLDLKTGKLLHNVKVLTTTDPGPKHRFNAVGSAEPQVLLLVCQPVLAPCVTTRRGHGNTAMRPARRTHLLHECFQVVGGQRRIAKGHTRAADHYFVHV